MKRTLLVIIFSVIVSPAGVPLTLAEGSICEHLNGDKHALAMEILDSQYPYNCCDDTILKCLKKEKTVCPLAIRLSENICRRVADDQDKQRISRALNDRGNTLLAMSFDQPKTFELANSPWVGEATAPITLVEFASARGPHCARMTPPIYEAVVKGKLKGKVKLYLKHFPIRKNPYSKETALGFLAAEKQGKLWELLLHSYGHFDDFTPEKLLEWAENLGIDREEFETSIKDPKLLQRIKADKMEGLENGVNSTPTFFINGHRYRGEVEIEELVDVLEEVYEIKQ